MTISEQGIKWGVFQPRAQGQTHLQAIEQYGAQTGRAVDVVHEFRKMGLTAPGNSGHLSTAAGQIDSLGGRTQLMTWEACGNDTRISGELHPSALAAGSRDYLFRQWAAWLANYPGDYYIRPFHEFNSNWYGWALDPACFRAAWKRIVRIFREAGADNVKWVWCPNGNDVPSWNKLEPYWPGSDYVDVLAFDQYNAYGGWQSFGGMIAKPYARVAALAPDLPIWVCETGTPEGSPSIANWERNGSQSKADWYRKLFATEGYERLACIVMFNHKGGHDWRIDSSPEALAAFREGLAASV